ncbi:MAG TPA: Hsp20/alpha crystallin family protein [Candidatus Binataceae bacterium]|nr:Hsp20/alpha crystallin family protein [Candidatus Binataceae bacterium]
MAENETREIATKEKQQLAQPQEQTRPGRYYVPDVNIYEFDDSLKLWADMPGVNEKDVNVTLNDGVLTIAGQVATGMYAGLRPLYTEYNVGNYYREFALNEDIDESKIKAKIRNGVLELELPKKEKAQPRQIEVRSA